MSTTLDEAREALETEIRHWGSKHPGYLTRGFEALARAVFREEIACSRAPAGEDGFDRMTEAELLAGLDATLPGLAPTPPAKDTGEADAGAKALAEWFRYSWDGLSDRDISDQFPDFTELPRFQGGKPALRKMAARISKPFVDHIADLEQRLAEAEKRSSTTAIIPHAERSMHYHDKLEAAERERDDALASLETAESRYRNEHAIVDRVWKALGVTTYEEAGGKEISQLVAEWKARAEATLASLETAERRIGNAVGFLRTAQGDLAHLVPEEEDREPLHRLLGNAIAALTPDAGTARSDEEGK